MPLTSQPCPILRIFSIYVIYFYVQTHLLATMQLQQVQSWRSLAYIPLIFCRLRLRLSQDGACHIHHRKLSHPFSQLDRPRWPRGMAVQQSACQMLTWPIFLFCFVLTPLYTSTLPSRSPSLFFSLIFRSQGDNVFQAEAKSLLSTCSPAPDM